MVQQYVQEFLFKSQLVKNYYLTRLYKTSFMDVALKPLLGVSVCLSRWLHGALS